MKNMKKYCFLLFLSTSLYAMEYDKGTNNFSKYNQSEADQIGNKAANLEILKNSCETYKDKNFNFVVPEFFPIKSSEVISSINKCYNVDLEKEFQKRDESSFKEYLDDLLNDDLKQKLDNKKYSTTKVGERTKAAKKVNLDMEYEFHNPIMKSLNKKTNGELMEFIKSRSINNKKNNPN